MNTFVDSSPGTRPDVFSASQKLRFWDKIGKRLQGAHAWVVLEPDALTLDNCWDNERVKQLRRASLALQKHKVRVYVDVGHSNWQPASTVVERLNKIGVKNFYGFSTNVSNYNTTKNETSWAEEVAKLLKKKTNKNKHFVIDTGRNGQGATGEWCNPPERGLGHKPKKFSKGLLDAYLWVKNPGESDGYCNGGPAAGEWFMDYALTLVKNRVK